MEIDEQLLEELTRADRPLTLTEVGRLLGQRASREALALAVRRLAEADAIHRWGRDRVWAQSPMEALPSTIRALLEESPKTSAALERALPPNRRVPRESLQQVLGAMIDRGDAFVLGGRVAAKRAKRGIHYFPTDPDALLERRLTDTLSRQPSDLRTLTRAIVTAHLTPTREQVRMVLDRLVLSGRAHRWKSNVYATIAAREALLEQLEVATRAAPEAMTRSQLRKALPLARRTTQRVVDQAVNDALNHKRLFRVDTRQGKERRTLYGGAVAIARVLIVEAEARHGIGREAFLAALGAGPAAGAPSDAGGQAATSSTVGEDPTRLLATIREVRGQSRTSLLPVERLRRAFPGSPERFDHALTALVRQRQVFVHEYSRPNPPPETVFLGPDGRPYGAVVLNDQE